MNAFVKMLNSEWGEQKFLKNVSEAQYPQMIVQKNYEAHMLKIPQTSRVDLNMSQALKGSERRARLGRRGDPDVEGTETSREQGNRKQGTPRRAAAWGGVIHAW